MNVFAPISSLMTDYKHLVTVSPEDTLEKVKEIFDAHKFHHIPVVNFREIVGIISKVDFEHFLGGATLYGENNVVSTQRLREARVHQIMTKHLGKVEPDDRINVALEIFTLNRFHALPVVKDGELVGIITPFDILKKLAEEKPAQPHMVYEAEN
ncbi:MAG: CBS domain-containing protein [Saprospiraceae bacterium]|nr:CBS domain-containing protein [Saprospiraceae bacterium]